MTRTIKFRAKRIDNGEWVEGHYYDDMGEHIIVAEGRHEVVDKSTLGQFTGLKDKNGVEIFESDIVRIGNKRHLDTTDIAEVRWFRGGFMLHLVGYFGYRSIEDYDNDCEKHEVIGNVTDNKELLS